MHEIGVLIEVVKSVEKIAKENEVTKIETLVLQIGELSSMVPSYMKTLYPVATEGTILDGSELVIEVVPANGLCRDCGKVFHLIEQDFTCPRCLTNNFDLLGGKEFTIKEMSCY